MDGVKKEIELNHYEAIRLLSGIVQYDADIMANVLAMVNLTARNALGMADDKFTDEQLKKCGIKLNREKPISDELKAFEFVHELFEKGDSCGARTAVLRHVLNLRAAADDSRKRNPASTDGTTA